MYTFKDEIYRAGNANMMARAAFLGAQHIGQLQSLTPKRKKAKAKKRGKQ